MDVPGAMGAGVLSYRQALPPGSLGNLLAVPYQGPVRQKDLAGALGCHQAKAAMIRQTSVRIFWNPLLSDLPDLSGLELDGGNHWP